MVETQTRNQPAQWFRSVVRQMLAMVEDHVPEDDGALRHFLEQLYADEKQHGDPFLLAVWATGLMSFGQLDVAEDAINGMLSPRQITNEGGTLHREQAWSVADLLSIPDGEGSPYYVVPTNSPYRLPDKEKLRNWLEDNASQFQWNDDADRFTVIQNAEV